MIEPINFFGALRQRWRLVVVLAVVGVVVALLLPTTTAKHPKTLLKWETWASVGAPASSGIIQGTVSNAQILFYSNTFPVKLAAVSDVGLKGNPYTYAGGMFGTTAVVTGKGAYPTGPGSSSASSSSKGKKAVAGGNVTLLASAPTPQLAAALTNAYAKELGNTLESQAAAHAAAGATTTKGSSSTAADGSPFAATATGYQVIFPGTPELAHRTNVVHTSTLDSHKVRVLGGLIIGAAIALVIILIREILNKTVRRAGRAQHHFKFPVIADVPETYPPDPAVVDVVDRPTSPAAEAYRKLRMSVLFEAMAAEAAPAGSTDAFADLFGAGAVQSEPYRVPEPGSRNVLLIASTVDEPSRSKVVANLAATYAEASERVIVVSTGDLEIGTTFAPEVDDSGPVTAEDIERWAQPAGPDNVWTLSMRHFMRNSGQLVSRSKAVLDAAREVAAVVIVETPAFLRYHHGEALVHSVDAVIVVVENGVTDVPDAQDMGDILRRLGAPVLGVVFTGEELSKSQRRVLDAGMSASGRSGRVTPDVATVTDVEDGGADDDLDPPDSERHAS